MNALDLFKNTVDELKKSHSLNESREFAFILIEHLFQTKKTQVLTNKPIDISENKLEVLNNYIERLNCHEPIQYITGECQFLDFKFLVNPSVLIPRPETEELVILIHRKYQNIPNLKVLDLCTGSGCIAVSLAKMLDAARLTALDISTKALETAKTNAALNKVEIEWLEADVLGAPLSLSGFDIVVSNPPYVTETEKQLMDKNVLDHEPHLALFVPDNEALIFYEKITAKASEILKVGGLLAFEINERFGKDTEMILYKYEFYNIEIIKDIHGKDRFVLGYNNLI